MRLHIDIESRSIVDLQKTGVYVYAEHPSTEILVVRYAFDDGGLCSPWFPHRGHLIPDLLFMALCDTTVTLVAHNAGFERVMLTGAPGQRIGIPDAIKPLGRWNCTAARAACMGLPRSLDGVAMAMRLPVQKDTEGKRLMLRMCKPVKPRAVRGEPKPIPGVNCPIVWLDDDASMTTLSDYCGVDVQVEQAVDHALPDLSDSERFTWLLTERMNDRGVLVDLNLIDHVEGLIEAAEDDVNARLRIATGYTSATVATPDAPAVPERGVPRVTNNGALTRWLLAQEIDDDMERLGGDGVGKAALAAMIERTDLPDLVREVLIMRREGGGASTKKYAAIRIRTSADGRIRGVLVYCGAAATGRWSSRGAQLHNLKRASLFRKYAQVENAIRDVCDDGTLLQLTDMYGPPLLLAAELLRPSFTAPGDSWLARGDSKQIEARVLPWLAGAEWKLNAFRRYDAGTGPDLYKVAAAGIYKTTTDDIASDDPRRQIGKVSELALGFQGGANALQAMAAGYGIKIPAWDGEQDKPPHKPPPDGTDEWIKRQWRATNIECSGNGREGVPLGLWRQLEDAAVQCMQSAPGKFVKVGPFGVGFFRTSAWLGMRLPSGRVLHYWDAKVIWQTTPWGTTKPSVRYMAEDSQTKQWRPFVAYGGLWTENLVQAVARDLMAYWLQQLQAEGFEPRLTVHDEAVCEVSRAVYPDTGDAARAVEAVMMRKPAWAGELPVSADSSAAPRYVKA